MCLIERNTVKINKNGLKQKKMTVKGLSLFSTSVEKKKEKKERKKNVQPSHPNFISFFFRFLLVKHVVHVPDNGTGLSSET